MSTTKEFEYEGCVEVDLSEWTSQELLGELEERGEVSTVLEDGLFKEIVLDRHAKLHAGPLISCSDGLCQDSYRVISLKEERDRCGR